MLSLDPRPCFIKVTGMFFTPVTLIKQGLVRWPGRSRNKAVDIEHCAVDIEHCAVDIEHCALDIEHCALDIEQLT